MVVNSLFIIGLIGTTYSYFIYPLLLLIIIKIRTPAYTQISSIKPSESPFISFIITAYNEEKLIAKKIENTLLANYPLDKLEIIIASDGSTDNTASIVQSSNAAKSHVIVTVDDGDMETSQNVVDICSKYDCPATFFVNSGYLQKSDNTKYHFPLLSRYYSDDEQYGEEITQLATRARITNNPTQYAQLCQRISVLAQELGGVDFDFVDYSFLESLDSELFSTCCHGRNHERFSMMSDCWQRQALEDDIAALNELASYMPMLCGGDACYSSPMPVYNRGIADVVGAKYRIEAELTRII